MGARCCSSDDNQLRRFHSAGWFLFHSMHSLCGIIGSSRNILTLDLFLPEGATAWTQSLCQSLVDVSRDYAVTVRILS